MACVNTWREQQKRKIAVPANRTSGIKLGVRRHVLQTVVPLLEHAKRRHAYAVTDEWNASGREPNELGVVAERNDHYIHEMKLMNAASRAESYVTTPM
jgi:hypothetical protein